MATSHHGPEELSLIKQFTEQLEGRARQRYPHGKLNTDDRGSLALAMAVDKAKGVIIIDFGKPVDWIGLRLEDAELIRDMLTAKMLELRGIN